MSESRESFEVQRDDDARDALDRILATEEAHAGVRVFGGRAAALQDESTAVGGDRDGEQFDREERA
ncbi:MAG TPA: GTPase HflX, partial [Protaetiibacter sp.]|nr:GTPase HflX [Protaetiibacter sp.]